jgi:signal transduction histidine kinase
MSGQRVEVQQTLFVDESGRLDFESARTQNFKPFNPLERLAIGDKVAWLSLHIERVDGVDGPLFLHMIPAHIGDVTLYSPSSAAPAAWNKRKLTQEELISRIQLGEATQGDVLYLKIESRNNVSILAFLGGQEEIDLHKTKLAVAMTFMSTLTLIALAFFVWRTLRHFSWMSVLICFLLVSYQIYSWIGLGFAYTILGWPLQLGINILTPNILANFGISGGILVFIGIALFPNQPWLRWLWTWSFLQFCLFIYAFFEPSFAASLCMSLFLFGPLLLGVCLVAAAIKEPTGLQQISNKLAFFLLLLTCVVLEFVAFKSGGVIGSHTSDLTTDLFITHILLKFPQLIVMVVLASWIFGKIQANYLRLLSNALEKSKESLEMESKRLERQRKFTAMLAHELKNPLAVSYLALSGIKARISQDDPLQQRSAAIEQSLQEIDAIIDRCSEMDGFEQGRLPIQIGAFTLNDLMAALKASHPGDRIYILVQGIAGEAVLVSDIHYLKIIFSNLLTNALKYSPTDTLVELAVQAVQRDGQPPMVSFCVSNEVGEAGTPSPDLAFERFYRAESARNQSGAGLGLWLSQSLAHALGTEVVMQTQAQKISFTVVLTCT